MWRFVAGPDMAVIAPGTGPGLVFAGDTRIVRSGVRAIALVTIRRLSQGNS